jgi:hypothetical protein
VGYVKPDEVRAALGVTRDAKGGEQFNLLFGETQDALAAVEEKAADVDRLYARFRGMQTGNEDGAFDAADLAATKAEMARRLAALNDELDRALARQYAIDPADPAAFARWRDSHQPFHWYTEFYGILKGGGFDVIIGNPPYVEYRLVKSSYSLPLGLYQSEATGNLFALCMERSSDLISSASGYFGMIVPAGVMGLDQALPLRELLFNRFRLTHYSTYGIRPSKLFDGVDQRLCIFLGDARYTGPRRGYTTKFLCWNAEERPNLFSLISYGLTNEHPRLRRMPQLGDPIAKRILEKVEIYNKQTIRTYYASNHGGELIHYHRSPRYWIRAMDFEQYFKSATRSRSIHHFRDIHFRTPRQAAVIGAILNSTLFFWWFITLGNGRNITGRDVEEFPVGDILQDSVDDLITYFRELMRDYQANSFIRRRTDVEFQEFRPSLSKPWIDQIDISLSRHYGFTAEELDYIINYDIKYRMGGELGED